MTNMAEEEQAIQRSGACTDRQYRAGQSRACNEQNAIGHAICTCPLTSGFCAAQLSGYARQSPHTASNHSPLSRAHLLGRRFELYRDKSSGGAVRMGVWVVEGLKRGEELLVSYGRGFWNARREAGSDDAEWAKWEQVAADAWVHSD